jgi:hypothetical protein
VVVVPTLLYGYGNLNLLQHARSTETAEMKVFRSVAECALYDHQINVKGRKKMTVYTVYIKLLWILDPSGHHIY